MDPQQPQPMGPLAQAADRLAWEASYLRDVLHLAEPNGQCRVSAASMQRVFEGLMVVLTALRQFQPITVTPAVPSAPTTVVQP